MNEHASTRHYNGRTAANGNGTILAAAHHRNVADAMDYAVRTVGTSSGMDLGGTGSGSVQQPERRTRLVDAVRSFADVVVGVFDIEQPAECVLDSFRREGFRREEIGLIMRAGALTLQADALALADAADRGVPTTLCELGVPRLEAYEYQREFEAGRSIVTVRAAGRARQAESLLQQAMGISEPPRKRAPRRHTAAARR